MDEGSKDDFIHRYIKIFFSDDSSMNFLKHYIIILNYVRILSYLIRITNLLHKIFFFPIINFLIYYHFTFCTDYEIMIQFFLFFSNLRLKKYINVNISYRGLLNL